MVVLLTSKGQRPRTLLNILHPGWLLIMMNYPALNVSSTPIRNTTLKQLLSYAKKHGSNVNRGIKLLMEFQLSYFKSWKMMLWKCCTQYASKFGKLSSGHWTGKDQFSFQSQRKAMLKNAQTTAQLHSSHMLAKKFSKFSKQTSAICEPWTSRC